MRKLPVLRGGHDIAAGMLLGYANRRGLVKRLVAVGSCSFDESLS